MVMNQGTQGALAALAVCFPLSLLPILANDSYPGDDDAAVPARIRVIEGGATLQRDREREQDRVEATVNMPVFPGDRIDVEGGPLELQLPEGSLIWLDEGASIQLLAVRDSSYDSREGTVLK